MGDEVPILQGRTSEEKELLFLARRLADFAVNDFSRLMKVLMFCDNFKFCFIILLDTFLWLALTATSGVDPNVPFEALWTLGQFLATNLFAFMVITYSRTNQCGECVFIDFLYTCAGFYNIQWERKRKNDDKDHLVVAKNFLRRFGNDLFCCRDELVSIIALAKTNLVDSNLEYIYIMAVQVPMTITKLYFSYGAPTHPDFSNYGVCRMLVILFGLLGAIKVLSKQDQSRSAYLKCLQFLESLDNGKLESFNYVWQNGFEAFLKMIIYSLYLTYRISFISYFFCLGFFNGILNLAIVFICSFYSYKCTRPLYENGPVGAPTRMYQFFEILADTLTLKNFKISNPETGKLWRRVALLHLAIAAQHYLCILIGLNLFPLMYRNQTYVSCSLAGNQTCWSGIVARTLIFPIYSLTPSFNATHAFIMSTLAVNVLHFICNTSIFYYYFCFYWCGLIDKGFPASAAIHIWANKLMKTDYSVVSKNWVSKMLFYTVHNDKVCDENGEGMRTLEIAGDEKVGLLNEDGLAENPQSSAIEKECRGIINSSVRLSLMKDLFETLIDYVFDDSDLEIFEMEASLQTRALCYNFIKNFETHMAAMNSQKIAKICKLLNESPIIAREFTDHYDEVGDFWFWALK